MAVTISPYSKEVLIQCLARLYPFFSGLGRLANNELGKRLLPPRKSTAESSFNGNSIAIPLDDYVGRRLLSNGDTVVDIGANLGIVTLVSAKAVGPSGVIHSFEPKPILVSMLKQSLQLNQFNNVVLHPTALGEERSIAKFLSRSGILGKDL